MKTVSAVVKRLRQLLTPLIGQAWISENSSAQDAGERGRAIWLSRQRSADCGGLNPVSRSDGHARCLHDALCNRNKLAQHVAGIILARPRDFLLRILKHLLPLGEPTHGTRDGKQHREHGSMRPQIKYIAAYRVAPVSAITHIAPMKSIEPWKDTSKFVLNFAEPAKEIKSIPMVKHGRVKAFQNSRYTTYKRLEAAKSLDDLW